MTETLIPTCTLRWFTDIDGERILQQLFFTPSGHKNWKAVEDVSYFDDEEVEARRRKMKERHR